MKENDRIVIINEKSRFYDRVFEVLVEYKNGDVCVQSEYYTFTKDEFVPEKLYNSKLYKALK